MAFLNSTNLFPNFTDPPRLDQTGPALLFNNPLLANDATRGTAEDTNTDAEQATGSPEPQAEPGVVVTLQPSDPVSQHTPSDTSTNDEANPLLSRVASLYRRLQAEAIQDYPALPDIKTNALSTHDIVKSRTEVSQSSLSQFGLTLRTQEGDVINLSIFQNSSAYTAERFDGRKGQYEHSSFLSTNSGYEFTVQGDLNKEEQAAVASFLEDITSLTDAFLEYDLRGVLAAVDNLSLDSELSGFALNLKTAYSASIEQKIKAQPMEKSDNPGLALGHHKLSNQEENWPQTMRSHRAQTLESTILAAYARDLLEEVAELMTEAKARTETFKEKFDNQFLEKLPNFIMEQWRLGDTIFGNNILGNNTLSNSTLSNNTLTNNNRNT